ncbi:hypothetical protein [Natrinema caseinilyticum]|uniref:hypothetical protein n=1 Tax=Natrinema caseinilyticum TaxID=2961570 RepID=UPI0020C28CA3|nr:hypothetical protein [Natrinema caseinilyticum]
MTDGHRHTRVRLAEVLAEVEMLDRHLPEPITMHAAIDDLETAIELLDRVDSTGATAEHRNR